MRVRVQIIRLDRSCSLQTEVVVVGMVLDDSSESFEPCCLCDCASPSSGRGRAARGAQQRAPVPDGAGRVRTCCLKVERVPGSL